MNGHPARKDVNHMKPIKKPVSVHAPIHVHMKPCSDCMEVTVDTPFTVTVPVTENDIFNWMTRCRDPEALRRLGKYAAKCAAGLEDPDNDDFRSRA